MRPIYNAPSTKPKKEPKNPNQSGYTLPLHMQHCVNMSSQQSNRSYGAKAAAANAKHSFKVTEQDSYKNSKKLAKETSVKNYKKGAEDAVKTFKGSQNLGYDNPEIQRHRRNAENASNIAYKEDYEFEKDQIYFMPNQNNQSKLNSDLHYKKKGEKDRVSNNFNACDTAQYKEQKQKKKSDLEYTKDYNENKHKYKATAQTIETEHAKKAHQISSQRLYKKEGEELMKNYDLNKGLMNRGDIAQSIHSQNQADVLNRNYKKEYENEKTNYEFQKTLAEVPEIRHNMDVSKNVVDATNSKYSKDAKQTNAINEYTKSFCDTDQYKTSKKITEITRDSIYQAGKEEAIKTHKGFQSLNIAEIPSFQQHEANQRAISKVAYREDWDEEKEAIYFPAHVTQSYENSQQAQKNISDSQYKEKAKDVMKSNQYNLAESDQYQKTGELRKQTNDLNYKAQYEADRNNFTSLAVTKEMERAKELENLKDSKYREQYEKEKIQNNFDLSANDFQLAKHMQDLASDRQYQQVYDQDYSEEESDEEDPRQYAAQQINVSQEQYYSSRHVETVAEESEHELTSQPEMNSYSDHSEQEAQYQGQVQMNHDGYMSEMTRAEQGPADDHHDDHTTTTTRHYNQQQSDSEGELEDEAIYREYMERMKQQEMAREQANYSSDEYTSDSD